MSIRLADWRPRLEAFIGAQKSRSFAWGRWDCALFAAGAVEAMTGVDHARGFRGYRTEAAGRKALADKGFADHVALVAARFEEIHPSQALPGDLVVVPAVTPGEWSLGILAGRHVYVVSEAGLAVRSRSDVVRAFKV